MVALKIFARLLALCGLIMVIMKIFFHTFSGDEIMIMLGIYTFSEFVIYKLSRRSMANQSGEQIHEQ
jgi:hypothetical protein